MKCLVVIAHPLADSLCHTMARAAVGALVTAGHEIEIEDLCGEDFAPSLRPSERQSYYRPPFDASALEPQIARLLAAEALLLVFPT